MPTPPDNPWKERRTIALFFAVVHHGFSNFAAGSVPPHWHKVIETAEKFREYLEGTMPTDDRPNRRR